MFTGASRNAPLTTQINAMTSKATEYRTAHGQPSALFEIELWCTAIIVALRQPHTLAVPLHMFIRNLRDREPYPTVSDASPLRLCAALYSFVTGEVLAWVTYRLPYKKDIVCKSQGHREYLGHLLSILLLVKYSKAHPANALQYYYCAGVGGGKESMQIDRQPVCMYGS